jgi:uncharacterized protein YcaQ
MADNASVVSADKEDEGSLQTPTKPMYNSIMSLIPFTNAWYEANVAEEELDNLTKIHMEVYRSEHIVRQCKAGEHEEILQQLLADVPGQDFHYFNKFMHEQRESGGWNWVSPLRSGLFAVHQSNRLRKAMRMRIPQYYDFEPAERKPQAKQRDSDMVDADTDVEISQARRPDKNCSWR